MLCPNGHSNAYKFGTYRHVNGVAQRYRCRVCRAVFSEGKVGVNRLSIAKREIVKSALLAGWSFRKTALLAKVHLETVRSEARRLGIKAPPRNKGERERGDYQTLWLKRQGITHMMITQRNDVVRASIALLLAKCVTPLTKEQIYRAMLPHFPWLKQYSVTNMLKRNADHCFKEINGEFTFEPSPFYSPAINFKPGKERGTYYQLMDAARAEWHDARELVDEHVEQIIDTLKQRNEIFIRKKRNERIDAEIKDLNKRLRKFSKP